MNHHLLYYEDIFIAILSQCNISSTLRLLATCKIFSEKFDKLSDFNKLKVANINLTKIFYHDKVDVNLAHYNLSHAD